VIPTLEAATNGNSNYMSFSDLVSKSNIEL
jgi:hypothetical protein